MVTPWIIEDRFSLVCGTGSVLQCVQGSEAALAILRTQGCCGTGSAAPDKDCYYICVVADFLAGEYAVGYTSKVFNR